MRKSKRPTVGRNKPRLTKRWENKMNIDETPSKPIDLSFGSSHDSWDDCLDELDDLGGADGKDDASDDDGLDDFFDAKGKGPSAILRLQAMTKANIYGIVGKPKKIRKKLAGPVRRISSRSKPKAKSVKIVKAVPTIGPRSTPEPNDKALRSLWRCKTVEEVKAEHSKWDQRFNAKCTKGIAKRKLADNTRVTIAALLDGSATNIPILTNNKMLALSWETCHRAIWASTKDVPDIEFALVTFIPGDGGTSLNQLFIERHHSRDAILKVLRAMGKDFIGTTELAMFNSHGHPDGGRHVQRHEHALIWGKGVVAKAQEVALRRMQEFSPNITGAPQIDVRRVAKDEVNLARVCAYLFKSPHKCMNWNPPKDGKPGHMNQSENGDRMIRYLRMAQMRSMMTVEDIMFAGGAGVTIRGDLIRLLRQTCHSDVPVQNRLLHPDEIGTFWAEVNKELKRPEWRVPIIARRP
jgi:hypothetical protein